MRVGRQETLSLEDACDLADLCREVAHVLLVQRAEDVAQLLLVVALGEATSPVEVQTVDGAWTLGNHEYNSSLQSGLHRP